MSLLIIFNTEIIDVPSGSVDEIKYGLTAANPNSG